MKIDFSFLYVTVIYTEDEEVRALFYLPEHPKKAKKNKEEVPE